MILLDIQEFLKKGQYRRPSNTPMEPIFDTSNWEIVRVIEEFNKNTKAFFKGAADTVYYFTHPKEFAWVIWNGLVDHSFEICLFICFFGLITYIIGWEKGKVWAKGSVIAYIIIMMFNSAL